MTALLYFVYGVIAAVTIGTCLALAAEAVNHFRRLDAQTRRDVDDIRSFERARRATSPKQVNHHGR